MKGKPTENGVHAARGATRLLLDAVEQITNIVEGMHANIAAGKASDGKTRGITGLVYDSIRLINGGVRTALDAALRLIPAQPGPQLPQPQWDAVRALVNGVLGDFLAATGNPLAIGMQLRRDGRSLLVERGALAAALPQATGRLLVAIHGLCLNDRHWTLRDHNHAERLAAEFGLTPVYLSYNTGRHVSENGRDFAAQLEALVAQWPAPVEDITLLAHSMGGLVARSAEHYAALAGHRWPERLRRMIFLGTPHHGAPLERGGNWLQSLAGISPYTKPLARLGMLRSAGVTDLRYGNVLDEDWQDRDRFEPGADPRRHVPLPQGVRCFAAAVSLSAERGDLRDRVLGDGLVLVDSALGEHADPARALNIPADCRWLGHGRNHWDLLCDADLFDHLRAWARTASADLDR